MTCGSTGGCPHRSVNIQYTGKCTLCHPGTPTVYFPGKIGKEKCANCEILEAKIAVLEEELQRCRGR